MNIDIERKYREELQFQIKHWRERASIAEKYLRMLMQEIPGAQAFIVDKAKCDVKDANVQCKSCNCWKKQEQKEPFTDEP